MKNLTVFFILLAITKKNKTLPYIFDLKLAEKAITKLFRQTLSWYTKYFDKPCRGLRNIVTKIFY